VTGGNQVIPIVNSLVECFDLVLATQDWHPANHGSFAANHPNRQPGDVIELNGIEQVLWPVHCVQGSPGAEFSTQLRAEYFAKTFRKGIDPGIDSYSGFFDNAGKRSTGLAEYLRERRLDELFICGLATDYCVKFSALDSIDSGIRTHVIEGRMPRRGFKAGRLGGGTRRSTQCRGLGCRIRQRPFEKVSTRGGRCRRCCLILFVSGLAEPIRDRSGGRRTAAGPFSSQPSGPGPVGCFSSAAADRPV
jgi:nicotinamidase/pyrazinamidase